MSGLVVEMMATAAPQSPTLPQATTYYNRHEDAQPIDEVTIRMVPRYKTSMASGNEWRVSAVVECKRKGRVVHDCHVNSMERAVLIAGQCFVEAQDDVTFEFPDDKACCQPGCSEPPVVARRLKRIKDYRTQQMSDVPSHCRYVNVFCARHSTRGDCGLEDNDANYEALEGDATPPLGADESRSKAMYL